MAMIPDAAVEAGLNAMHPLRFATHPQEELRAAIEAALPHLAQQTAAKPDELEAFLYQLESNIERAESPDWCVLHLNVQQGENVLRLIRERTQAS